MVVLKEVVSYATREMRDGEIDGREHWFISPEKAKELKKEKRVLAHTMIGRYEYFTTDENVKGCNLYVIDPNGIKYLKSLNIDREIKIIYVSVPDEIRDMRAKSRSDYETAYKKRCENENNQFKEFEQAKEWDIEITNISLNDSLEKFVDFIKNTYNDKVLYCIVGRTCSGKDTLIKKAKEFFI